MIQISVINKTNGALENSELQEVIRAVNYQVEHDFHPYTDLGGNLRLSGHLYSMDNRMLSQLVIKRDAIIYLTDELNIEETLNFHLLNNQDIPYKIVFIQAAEQAWSVDLSRFTLELLMETTLLDGKNEATLQWYSSTDNSESQQYIIDGIAVSNFSLAMLEQAASQ